MAGSALFPVRRHDLHLAQGHAAAARTLRPLAMYPSSLVQRILIQDPQRPAA